MPAGPETSTWTDVAAAVGIRGAVWSGSAEKTRLRETVGQGACWIDFDKDGDPDLFVPNGARGPQAPPAEPWYLYENTGGRFQEAGERLGLPRGTWGVGCAVGDVDGDGYDDLFVTGVDGPTRLLLNRRGLGFVEQAPNAGAQVSGFSTSAAFGDVDADGDLDLFVARYVDEARPPRSPCFWKGVEVMCGPKGFPMMPAVLLLNDGRGRWRDASRAAGILGHPGYGLGVAMFDADDDSDLDVYVANDSSPKHLFFNRGNGTFEERGVLAGSALSESGTTQAGMGVDAADLDGDGRFDLVVTNFSDDYNNFYRNDGGGFFSERAAASGLARLSRRQLGWSVLAEDFDLDGDVDLFVANGHVYPAADRAGSETSYLQAPQLLFNDGQGVFSEAPSVQHSLAPVSGRGAATADFDRDGDLDVLLVRDGAPPMLFRNSLPRPGTHWLRVRIEGCRGNPRALGARVTLVRGGRSTVRQVSASRGYLSSSEPVVTFGLGISPEVEAVDVQWRAAERIVIRRPTVDRELIIRARCPENNGQLLQQR